MTLAAWNTVSPFVVFWFSKLKDLHISFPAGLTPPSEPPSPLPPRDSLVVKIFVLFSTLNICRPQACKWTFYASQCTSHCTLATLLDLRSSSWSTVSFSVYCRFSCLLQKSWKKQANLAFLNLLLCPVHALDTLLNRTDVSVGLLRSISRFYKDYILWLLFKDASILGCFVRYVHAHVQTF